MAQSRMNEHRTDHGLRAAYGFAIAVVIAAGIWALRVLVAQYWS